MAPDKNLYRRPVFEEDLRMLGRVSLSTTICDPEAGPGAILERWLAVCEGRLDQVALGAHLPPAAQAQLLSVLRGRGLTCAELGHPLHSAEGRPAASCISEERQERAAALEQLCASVERAADVGVQRVVLAPQWLELALGAGQLARQYAEDRPLDLAACLEERAARGPGAMDGLCSVLDGALNRAQRYGVGIALLAPAAWPHQVPHSEEIDRLQEIFTGAPLWRCTCVDWIYLAAQLGGGGRAEPDRASPLLRLADACGLITGLPPGCGEITRDALFQRVGDAREVILTLAPLTLAAELRVGLDALEVRVTGG